jgi:hypothetical protein
MDRHPGYPWRIGNRIGVGILSHMKVAPRILPAWIRIAQRFAAVVAFAFRRQSLRACVRGDMELAEWIVGTTSLICHGLAAVVAGHGLPTL